MNSASLEKNDVQALTELLKWEKRKEVVQLREGQNGNEMAAVGI